MDKAEAVVLVVTANWGFTDGTLVAPRGRGRAARAWLRMVRTAAIRAGFGADGRYRPPAGLDLVLAGDTCDCLLSAEWCGRERPWHDGARARELRQRVTIRCVRRAAPLLAGLVRLVRAGLPVPAADRRGRPVLGSLVRVPVRAVAVPGDRDRQLAAIAARATSRDLVVAPAWSDGEVLVRHGHECDAACHADTTAGNDRPPSLAESLAADLVGPFALRLADLAIPRAAAADLIAALAAAAPLDLAAVIAAWSGDGPGAALGDPARRAVAAAWQTAIAGWLRIARHSGLDCGLPTSPVESLAAWLGDPRPEPPPAALEALRCRATDTGLRAGGREVVLGHPAPAGPTPICLGQPPVRRWSRLAVVRGASAAGVACVDAATAPSGPATVMRRRDLDGPRWLWLGAEGAAAISPVTEAACVVDAA